MIEVFNKKPRNFFLKNVANVIQFSYRSEILMIKFTHLKDTSAGTSEKRSRRDILFPVLTARVYEPGKKFMFCILKIY